MAETEKKQKNREAVYSAINRRLWDVVSENETTAETALQALAELFYDRLEELGACWFGIYLPSPSGNSVLPGPHSRLRCCNLSDTRQAADALTSGRPRISHSPAPGGHCEICVPVTNGKNGVMCVIVLRSEKKQNLGKKDARGLEEIAGSLADFLKNRLKT